MTDLLPSMPASGIRTDSGSTVLRGVRVGLDGTATDLRVDGRWVTAIGDQSDYRDAEQVIDATGATVLPGMWDAHVHAVQWATAHSRIDVSAATSAEHAARLVAEVVTEDQRGVVVGYGFRDSDWDVPLHKDALDQALPGLPVMVISNDMHTICLSTPALSLAGQDHHPTGVFDEAEALAHIAALSPADADVTDAWLHEAMVDAASRGVTGLLDFEVADNLTAWLRRHRQHPLPMRVTAVVYPDYLDAAIEQGLRTGQPLPGSDGMIEVGPLKIFVDGSLNARSAWCHDPYPGSGPTSYGTVTTEPEQLHSLMRRSAAHGLLPAVHAIGDRAVTTAIDAFETVGCAGRIEHAQLISAPDLPRLRELGITVGVQPAHIAGDRDVAERLWDGRSSRAFALGDMVRHGARIEIGSDAPVAPLDPWRGIANAVHRTDSDRTAWHPRQSIPLRTALPAAARGRDRIRVGELADLVVVASDLDEASPSQLAATPVLGTMVDGHWTYRDSAFR